MLKAKKAVFALVSLLALTMIFDSYISGAQTKKGGKPAPSGGPNLSGAAPAKGGPKLSGLGPRPGVNYDTFDHTTHSLNCQDCHEVKDGERVTVFPGHNACEECHSIVSFTVLARVQRQPGFCLICHEKDLVKVLPNFPDQRDDQFSIKFPHSVHVGLDAKDYSTGLYKLFDDRNESERKIQEVAQESGCLECHVKEGKENKEENFSTPHHPECWNCHGVSPKKVDPDMNNCLGCHIPFGPFREAATNITVGFRHDKDHERDTRPDVKKVKDKDTGKMVEPMLNCKFCHKEAAASKRLADVGPPFLSTCLACHNNTKKASGHELTVLEAINMKADPVKADKK